MTRLFAFFRPGVWAFLMLMAFWSGAARAATCNSIDPGNWSFTGNWSCNKVPDSGDDVTISHAISLNSADREARAFTIAAGGTLSDTGNMLTVTGAVVINGTWSGAGGGRLVKNGTGNLSGTGSLSGNTRIDINGNTSILSTTNLTFTDVTNGRIDIGASVTVTNNGTVTVAQVTEDNTASTWTNAASSTLNVYSNLLNGSGVPADAGTLNASASGNTVNYLGSGNQDVKRPSSGNYFHLTLGGGGTKTLVSGSTHNILGSLTINAGATYDANANDPAVNITGKLEISGTYTGGGGAVTLAGNFEITSTGAFASGASGAPFTFNGTSPQTLTGPAGGTTTFSGNFRVNNASGLSFLPLAGVHVVSAPNGVNLQLGRITTNANILYLNPGAAISNAGAGAGTAANPLRFVIGNLRKRVLTGASVARQFEVGTDGGPACCYARVVATFNVQASPSGAGDFTVSTTVDPTTGHHPNIGTSTLDAGKSVNRYWTFTNNSVIFNAAGTNTLVFNFNNPADLDAGVDTNLFFASRYNGSTWAEITPTGRTATTTTIQVGIAHVNVTNNAFQIAQKLTAPAAPAGGFDVFETGQADGATPKRIFTKVAGTGFDLSVMAIDAGGAKIATFTGTGANVKLEVLGNVDTGVSTDPTTGCPVTSTTLQTIASFNITGGRSTASFAAQANSWRDVRVRVSYPTTSPTVTKCSSDNFAIRPVSFALAAADTDWASPATTPGPNRTLSNNGATGGVVHKAGQPFTLTVTTAAGTTNYNGSPTVSALACVLPAGGTCAPLTLLDPGSFTGGGTRVSNAAKYDEVGVVNVTLVDTQYASVDSGDGTPNDCTATGRWVCQSPVSGTPTPLTVGRFVPDHFAVTQVTAPIFRTFDTTDASCSVPPSGARRSFTYLGQFFGYQTPPSAMIVAQNAGNQTTSNYRGTLWKLTNASAAQQFANSPAKTLDITQIGSPVVAETPGTGTGTLTPAAAGKLAFQRNNSTPEGEFTASLSLTLSVSDASEAGTGETTPTPIATTTPQPLFSSMAFDGDGAASGKTFRYGRLQIGAARGELSAPLAVPMETQYAVNSTTFTTNTADHCTSLDAANFGLGNFAGNLAAGETTILASSLVGAFTAGKKSLTLTAPGTGNNGSVDIVANLGATTPDSCTTFKPSVTGTTGANQSWLRERGTCSTTYIKDPTGRAIFGVRLGAEEVIHFRENF